MIGRAPGSWERLCFLSQHN